MTTTSIRYTQADNSQVFIEPQGYSVPQPCQTWHQEIIDEWIAEGNTIEAYNQYYEWTEQQAYETKEAEIDTYSDNLIANAYANPIQGITVNPDYYKKKINRRKSNKSDKIASEIELTDDEKNEAKTDEKLSEYEVKITADQDKAITNLHKLGGVENIMSFNVEAESWNVWTPPI